MTTAIVDPSTEVNKAAREQLYFFIGYVAVLLIGALLTVLLWRSGNKYQAAIKADAEARIEQAKTDAKLESKRIEEEGKKAIARVEADSRERIEAAKSEANVKIAETKERTAQLEQGTAELRERNLATEMQLSEANRTLEAEKTKRLELEKSIAPRGLAYKVSGNPNSDLETLKPFAETKVIFEVLTDAEARRAAQEIGNLLMFANWKTVGTTSNPELFTGFFDGVIIVPDQAGVLNIPQEQAKEEKRLLDAAEALQEFLESRGWKSRVQRFSGVLGADSPFGQIPKNTIKIIVGFKPNPFFEPDWVKEIEEKSRKAKEHMREMERKHPPGKP